ncbi:MAG: hypothetical protein R3F39_04275 [Myxococcota bacterium]
MVRSRSVVLLWAFGVASWCACDPGGGGSKGGDTSADAGGEVVADTGPDSVSDADAAGDADTSEDLASDGDAAGDGGDAAGDAAGDADHPYCPGFSPPPLADSCRSEADCDGLTFCRYPGQQVCGICRHPENNCDIASPSTSCGEGQVCVSRLPFCACSSEEGTYCELSCAANPSSCGTAACLPSGFCAPESCLDDGVDCPTNFVCSPQSASADAKGCARRTCATDAACDCGACVFGRCYEGPGICSPPVP